MVHRENTSSFPTSSSSSWKIIIFRYIRQLELIAYECAHCRSSMSSIFLILCFTFLCIFHSSSVGVVFVVVVVVLVAAFVSLFFRSLSLFLLFLLAFTRSNSIDSTIVAAAHQCSRCQWNVASRLLHDYQEISRIRTHKCAKIRAALWIL